MTNSSLSCYMHNIESVTQLRDVAMASFQKENLINTSLHLESVYYLQQFAKNSVLEILGSLWNIWSPVQPFTAVLNLCHSDDNRQ